MNKKKKFIIIICMLALISPVFAANWQEIQNNGKKIYVDEQSMIGQGSQLLYWIKFNNGAETYKLYMVSDCETNENALKKKARYTKDNRLIESKTYTDIKLEPVVPDSDAEKAHVLACGIYKDELNKQNQAKLEQENAKKQAEEQALQEQQAKAQEQARLEQQAQLEKEQKEAKAKSNVDTINTLNSFVRNFSKY